MTKKKSPVGQHPKLHKIPKSHSYSSEQNEWILKNASLHRTELAGRFNLQFGTNVNDVALSKQRQRLREKAKSGLINGTESDAISPQEILTLIKDSLNLIAKLIDKIK